MLDVVFRTTGRFEDVLYLIPEPSAGLRQVTLAIAGRWPEALPYGAAFSDVVPHLTVAHGAGAEQFADAEAEVVRRLPLHARLDEACA